MTLERASKYLLALVAAVLCLILLNPEGAKADPGDITGKYKGGLVAATTTAASTSVNSSRIAALYFENLDATDTVVIAFDGATAAYAGTAADYTDQLVLGPGESAELALFGVNTFSIDASGNANVVYRAIGFK